MQGPTSRRRQPYPRWTTASCCSSWPNSCTRSASPSGTAHWTRNPSSSWPHLGSPQGPHRQRRGRAVLPVKSASHRARHPGRADPRDGPRRLSLAAEPSCMRSGNDHPGSGWRACWTVSGPLMEDSCLDRASRSARTSRGSRSPLGEELREPGAVAVFSCSGNHVYEEVQLPRHTGGRFVDAELRASDAGRARRVLPHLRGHDGQGVRPGLGVPHRPGPEPGASVTVRCVGPTTPLGWAEYRVPNSAARIQQTTPPVTGHRGPEIVPVPELRRARRRRPLSKVPAFVAFYPARGGNGSPAA